MEFVFFRDTPITARRRDFMVELTDSEKADIIDRFTKELSTLYHGMEIRVINPMISVIIPQEPHLAPLQE